MIGITVPCIVGGRRHRRLVRGRQIVRAAVHAAGERQSFGPRRWLQQDREEFGVGDRAFGDLADDVIVPVKHHRQTASFEAHDRRRQQIARDPGHHVLDDRAVPLVDLAPCFFELSKNGKIDRALELARDQAGARIGEAAAGRQRRCRGRRPRRARRSPATAARSPAPRCACFTAIRTALNSRCQNANDARVQSAAI